MPPAFFGDVIDNKRTSLSLPGWVRPRGDQTCPLGPILGHEKWKFQGDEHHHLRYAFHYVLFLCFNARGRFREIFTYATLSTKITYYKGIRKPTK